MMMQMCLLVTMLMLEEVQGLNHLYTPHHGQDAIALQDSLNAEALSTAKRVRIRVPMEMIKNVVNLAVVRGD